MKFNKLYIGAFLLLLATCDTAMGQTRAFRGMLKTLLSHTVPEVNVAQARAQQDQNAYLLDARAWEEYEVSHLKNARYVGYDDFTLDRVADIPKDSAVVVYCSVGYRSEKVAEKLIAAGYSNVSNLYGGIFQWVNEQIPIVDQTNQPTKKVHAYNRVWGVWLKKGEKVY